MKKSIKVLSLIFVFAVILSSFAACKSSGDEKTAVKKTITVDVVDADKKTEQFTFVTEADNLEDALVNENFISGDVGEYGLYIKTVNGIRADYELDGAYWSISRGEEMLTTGAKDEIISDGGHYIFTYTTAN